MNYYDLIKQRQKLDAQIAEAKEIEIQKKYDKTYKKLDQITPEEKKIILKYMKHSCSSCSDDNPCNGYGSAEYGAKCNKCFLVEIFNGEHGGRFDFNLNVVIDDNEVI